MSDFTKRIYDYEAMPPEGVWNDIAKELESSEANVIPIKRKNNRVFYYLAAASVAIIVFCVIFFTSRSPGSEDTLLTTSADKKAVDSGSTNSVIITVPVEEKTIAKNNGQQNSLNKTQKSTEEQNRQQDSARNNDPSSVTAINTPRYITIEGPQGQPVKISSKMATLIDSSETQTPTKPIWNKKINEWRELMKVNTLAPTTGNFLDIVELTKALKDNKKP